MVFFVCGACGDSFKRKQADVHVNRCRNWSFSCMDCNKDFLGNSYAQHTQCITEHEKYFGSHHVAKIGKDKNKIWMDNLKQNLGCRTDLKPFIKRLIDRIVAYPNVPRKQDKFANFLKTSMNMSNPSTVEQLWQLVHDAATAPPPQPPAAAADDKDSSDKENATKKKKKTDDTTVQEEQPSSINETTAATTEQANGKKKRKREQESQDCSNGDVEVQKKSKKKKRVNVEEDDCPVEAEEEVLSKSQKRKRSKLLQSATEEPDLMQPLKFSLSDKQDFASFEDIEVETVKAEKSFRWRANLKAILKEHKDSGMKITKLLNKIERLHNDPLHGSDQPLPRDTLESILKKNLANKPFTVSNNRVTMGKFKSKA